MKTKLIPHFTFTILFLAINLQTSQAQVVLKADTNSKCLQNETGFSFTGNASTYGSSNKVPTPDKCPTIFLNKIKKETKNYCKTQNYRKNYLTQLIYYGQSFTGGELTQGCKTVGLGCCSSKKN